MNETESGFAEQGAGEQEQEVTPLELFFDLVFVFAFTQEPVQETPTGKSDSTGAEFT